MNILRRHTLYEILKVGLVTEVIATLMLVAADLFMNLEMFTSYDASAGQIIKASLLYAPEAFLLAMGPAFLFSVTYYLSMLHSNNEIMSVYNSGVSYRKLIRPILVLSLVLGLLSFFVNENVAIPLSLKKTQLTEMITQGSENSSNNTRIALSDPQSGYLVYARNYYDNIKLLSSVTLIRNAQDCLSRADAKSATWNDVEGRWVLSDVRLIEKSSDNSVKESTYSELELDDFTLEPRYFSRMTNEMTTLDLESAFAYLRSIRQLSRSAYCESASVLYKRLLSCLTVTVMVIISCSINYRFKKNILFLSIIFSLCVSVAYYVIQMVTDMLASQGVIEPYLGSLIPLLAVFILSRLMLLIKRD